MPVVSTLEELAALAGVEVSDFLDFKEKDIEDLTVELGVPTVSRVRLRKLYRELLGREKVSSANAKFAAFFERIGGAGSLAGLQNVPVSTLPVAISFIRGRPGAPSAAALDTGWPRRTPRPTRYSPKASTRTRSRATRSPR